ncbi:MAG TPA: condensation domain-containing protein [Pseudonocardiaceae bacterium]|nr:condensation domain-containing protein [Pseudonocardiaceae bacterium]
MKLTDILHWDARPGRLIEWRLHPATVASADDAPEDSRPPAYIQESHVRTVQTLRQRGRHIPAWVGTAFDMPGQVDLDILEFTLQRWTRRHETLCSGFQWVGDELRRFTLDPDTVRLQRDVVGEFPRAQDLCLYLQDRFDAATDALSWPNFIYAAAVRDDSTSLYLAFDHTNVDAYSLQLMAAEIHDLYTASVEGRPAEPPEIGSYVDFCEIERAQADQIDESHEIVARWRDFIVSCDGMLPTFPLELGIVLGELPRQNLLQEMLVDGSDAAAFEAYCRVSGSSLAGILAASSIAILEVGGCPTCRTVVPFHTRMRPQWSESVGWYVGVVPIEIPTVQARDFWGVLEMARDALRSSRLLAQMPIARVLRLLGSDFRPASPDMFSLISYVDARAVPGADRWAEWNASTLIRVSHGDQVCVWITRIPEGLQLACRYPDTDVAHKNMLRFVEELRKIIISVARTGGYGEYLREPDIRRSSSRVGQHVRGTGPRREQGPVALTEDGRDEPLSRHS